MNKENNIIINLQNKLFLSINNLIKREKLLAEYFISQRDYTNGGKFPPRFNNLS